jgi:hypothetical protein
MDTPIWDNCWFEVIDDQGRRVEMPYKRYLQLQKRRAAEADRALGIERRRIPVNFFPIPNHPDASKFIQLVAAIEKIPYSVPVRFTTQEANIWLRCQQLYWGAKAFALVSQLYPLPMPDPLAEGSFIQTKLLPATSFHNLKIDVKADESWYRLLVAGETEVRQWAKDREYHYPFSTAEDLFIETLKIGFENSLAETILCPVPRKWTQKQNRDHYRQWMKFLKDGFDGDGTSKVAQFEAVLMNMSWKGYALCALRYAKTKNKELLSRWKKYIKAQGRLINLQGAATAWDDEQPYQSTVSPSGHSTRRKNKLRSKVTEDGYFTWHRDTGDQ